MADANNLHASFCSDFLGLDAPKPAKKAPKSKATAHGVEVGAIFSESWGYEQTNVNFYQVVRVTRTMVVVQEIESRRVAADRVEPVVDTFVADEEPMRRKVRAYNGASYIDPRSYTTAKVWDGQPCYCTPWGMGH